MLNWMLTDGVFQKLDSSLGGLAGKAGQMIICLPLWCREGEKKGEWVNEIWWMKVISKQYLWRRNEANQWESTTRIGEGQLRTIRAALLYSRSIRASFGNIWKWIRVLRHNPPNWPIRFVRYNRFSSIDAWQTSKQWPNTQISTLLRYGNVFSRPTQKYPSKTGRIGHFRR